MFTILRLLFAFCKTAKQIEVIERPKQGRENGTLNGSFQQRVHAGTNKGKAIDWSGLKVRILLTQGNS